MKILAIDTSTHVMGVALAEDNKLLGEYVTNFKKNHSLRLMPAIHELLKELDIKPQDLDAIAVAKGPGSYTGVRIGVTTAKSMAWALNIPVYGVSSLKVLARNGTYFSGVICPFIDARRGQVYTGLYKMGAEHQIKTIISDHIVAMEDWLHYIKEKNEPVLFLSQDYDLHHSLISESLADQAVVGNGMDMLPKPSVLLSLAFEQEKPISAHALVPEYTQRTEAEKKWLEKKEGKTDA
ncbi:tRNA (adenosine(37)-N6)-threonylcarbamoyltransferase complex dimerization subunit type 1 TsaB [Alteribacillus iranensis]|uniref:tRNA threonylcarbamoyladenosine biosynthesis protein TsaB n=1 Tax=Alteribacillus iranensis TaxID=930128 RepID=A0A1I2EE05_9BACI|nr:tRNA (adenosine(37)-N6)-threonylcarbamoyltransferase complex dimerization subunit type 1 TsaB [Alteribacillus iranensis]SFE90470.1 tRNA threonylcarbamoyladenosine biosynthesis protein TsaB [Alteribacillus iranensis]